MAALVKVVDDDASVRKSLHRLIKSIGLDVKVFGSAEEFLDSPDPCNADCLVVDVRLPGMTPALPPQSGLDWSKLFFVDKTYDCD